MNGHKEISIIDYGINNLKSVTMSIQKIGGKVRIISSPAEVLNAKCLILPGIGAFKDGMDGLRSRGLIEPIKQKVSEGVPLLGICLGMQMLFSSSHEFGFHEGLNIIPGTVVPFDLPETVNLSNYKVPHMGWNELLKKKQSILDFNSGDHFFFVHSFYPKVNDPENVVAVSTHGDQTFCAIVNNQNVWGTQFHPEKSAEVGLKMLRSFCNKYCT